MGFKISKIFARRECPICECPRPEPMSLFKIIWPVFILACLVVGLITYIAYLKRKEKSDETRRMNHDLSEINDIKRGLRNAIEELQRIEAAVRLPPPPTPADLLRQLISAVAPLWTHGGQEEEEDRCSICLAPFSEGEFVRTLKFGHLFHELCCDQWFQRSFTCVYCRQSLFE